MLNIKMIIFYLSIILHLIFKQIILPSKDKNLIANRFFKTGYCETVTKSLKKIYKIINNVFLYFASEMDRNET